MKYFTLALFFTLYSLSISAQGIEFEHLEWRDALKKAKEENKLLFVDAYAKWCGPCKRMAKHEFTKQEVGDYYNANFINLKLDMESKDGRTFDSKYPVSAYPTLIFLDGDGNVVRREKGGRKGAQLISMGQKVMSSFDFSASFEERYEAGERDYDLILNYIKALNKGSANGLKVANDYLSSNPEISDDDRLMLVYEASVESDSRIFTELVENKKAIIKLVGKEKYNDKVAKASLSTINKAVEYEAPFLYDEALASAKDAMTDGYDDFEIKAKMHYALMTKNAQIYSDGLKKVRKKYKKDPEQLTGYMAQISSAFYNDEVLTEEYINIAEDVYNLRGSASDLLTYANALMLNGESKKALKLLNKEKDKFDKKPNEIGAIKRLIDQLQNQ